MKTNKTTEELRQAVEKILWREHNPDYSPNFEEVSEEIVALFCHQQPEKELDNHLTIEDSPEPSREKPETMMEAAIKASEDEYYKILNYKLKSVGVSMDSFKVFVDRVVERAVLSERTALVEALKLELPNALHSYAKWILENPDAEPLERKAKKNEITINLLTKKK